MEQGHTTRKGRMEFLRMGMRLKDCIKYERIVTVMMLVVVCVSPQVGEKVDARDCSMGAWFEAQVVKVTKKTPPPSTTSTTDEDSPACSEDSKDDLPPTLYYHVIYDE